MVGDNEQLQQLAEKIAETYDLEDLLDIVDLTPEEVVYILLEGGHIPEDIPHNV